jgi:hypothetical protein
LLGRGKERLLPAEDVLALFGHSANSARNAYLQFLADGIEQGLPKLAPGGRQVSQALDASLNNQYDNRILVLCNSYSFAANPSKSPLNRGDFKASPLSRGD